MDEHEHENGFQHLDLPLTGLAHKYDLGWKFEPNTDGLPGYLGEPYLLLYISFWRTDGPQERPRTLHYALTRSRWQNAASVGDKDREYLCNLALPHVQPDLLAVEQATEPAWLEESKRLYLP
jgi:hypothetical protein